MSGGSPQATAQAIGFETYADDGFAPGDAPPAGPSRTVTDRKPNPSAQLTPDLEAARPRDDLSPELRDTIAEHEVKGRPHDGWGTTTIDREGKEALGRFQMRDAALIDAGMKDVNGNWTGKYGVNSKEDFLDNPEAQKAALNDLTKRIEKFIQNKGLDRNITEQRKITGIKGEITITESGLVAATHREGIGTVEEYFKWLEKNDRNSRQNESTMPHRFKPVETRLRLFQDIPYKIR